MKKISKWLLLVGFLFGCGFATAATNGASNQIHHQEPSFIERGTTLNLIFNVPGIEPDQVAEAYLFYRHEGDISYKQQKASLNATKFTAPLRVEDRQATEVAYYFEIQLHNGEKVTYPQNVTISSPVTVEVIDERKSARQLRVEKTGVDYTILSPEPGTSISRNDVVIALTLFYDPDEIDADASSFELLLDGRDVTEQANASDYFYTYAPDELSPGKHEVIFNLINADSTQNVASWNFTVLDPAVSSDIGDAGAGKDDWIPRGRVEISGRNQKIGGLQNDALSGNVRLSGEKGNISYSAYGLLTSQEDPRLQAQNRFGAQLYVGEWFDLKAGHVYPRLSALTISGQRMQGLNVGFHPWDDALSLRILHGKLRRGIDNLFRNLEPEYQIQQQDTLGVSYLLSTKNGGAGTFERDITGGRLGVGRGKTFEFGLNFLKVEDDTSSINIIDNFNILMERNPSLAESLNEQERNDLNQNPEQLTINGMPRPKGNFVAASDLMVSLDSDRIRFEADGAFSLLNGDISEGTFSQERADDLGFSLDKDTENLLEQLSWLIIINENMDTLPLRFNADESGVTAEPHLPVSMAALDSKVGFNYYDNNLKIRYRWVGPAYRSLANSTIRNDIAGVTLTDRLQLLNNRVYLTLGYERLNDNVTGAKEATTNTNTYRANVSWFPLDQGLPRVSIGFLNRNRDNDVALFNPFVPKGVESAAVQNFEVQQGDTLIAPNARLTNSYQMSTSISQEFSLLGISHNASLSYSYTKTKDQRFQYGGALSNSLSMQVVNRFEQKPLQTRIGFNYNSTETGNGLTDIKILGFRVGGSMFLLDDKLNINASFAFTKNRTESISLGIPTTISQDGDNRNDYYEPGANNASASTSESHSYIMNASGRYNLSNQHSFLLSFRYSNIRNVLLSSAIPNDHLIQARYIFNF
ncbi:hypothetical protein [Fodinibius halophilus]|uniref:Uncharacterized protein n=1 Tax=Fodinibius halophilus TaxID=1736908 RepID=A0A6M1T4Y6_9BACT|nr:hypothetical protein [Fodinibius halophilus]NGP89139.1 hypothetical protein [Fodinibius halophilus]